MNSVANSIYHKSHYSSMDTGVIPFRSVNGLSKDAVSALERQIEVPEGDNVPTVYKNRVVAMADRAKSMATGLYNFFANVNDKHFSNTHLLKALHTGLSEAVAQGAKLLDEVAVSTVPGQTCTLGLGSTQRVLAESMVIAQ
jgi:hypothetical protein